jgi:HK97 family phage portal protein
MSLLGRLRAAFAPRASYGTLEERAFAERLELLGSLGLQVNEHTALQISTVWACVRVIAESIAMLPADVIERSNGRRSEVSDHPVSWLLNMSPDGEIPAFHAREALQQWALLWPGGYAEIERDRAERPANLHLIAPDRVEAKRDSAGRLVYAVTQDDGRRVEIPARNMLHLRGPSWDGTDGYGLIKLARRSFGLTAGMEIFGSSFFRNGAQLGTKYTTEQRMTPEQIAELRQQIEKLHTGAANAFKTAILHSGLKTLDSTMPLKDAQFLEGRRFQVLEVARWFRVPPHLVAELERATHSNVEQEQLAFVAHCLLPWAKRFEAEVNIKLFGRNQAGRQQVKLNFGALLRGDMKTRFEAYRIAREGGWMNADDIRELEDRNPLPDGQGKPYLVPSNMSLMRELAARADKAEADATAPAEPAPAADDDAPAPGVQPDADDPARARLNLVRT